MCRTSLGRSQAENQEPPPPPVPRLPHTLNLFFTPRLLVPVSAPHPGEGGSCAELEWEGGGARSHRRFMFWLPLHCSQAKSLSHTHILLPVEPGEALSGP